MIAATDPFSVVERSLTLLNLVEMFCQLHVQLLLYRWSQLQDHLHKAKHLKIFGCVPGYSPGSTLKKKKGQTSDQCGVHHHSIGGLTHAKTQGLGPTVPQPGLFSFSTVQDDEK